MTNSDTNRPLSGITILDLSRILAGPWTTQMLADLGADVIKIERPRSGDDTRTWGPPYAKTSSGESSESAYFLGANRGKRSLAIDLKSPEGAPIVRDIAAKADVVVENFKTGDLARYGLDADTMHKVNPGLIYASITGFGHTGPRASQAGYDLLIQGMAGLMSITGNPDDTPGAGPTKVGVAVVDVMTGLHATIGILASIIERGQTGKGRHLDISLFDVCAAGLANQAMNWLVGGQIPKRMGNAHPSISPYQIFPASDGHMILAVGNDSQFIKFCDAAGLPELPEMPEYKTNAARVTNRDVLIDIVSNKLRTQTRTHWLDLLEPLGVPCGPINNVDEVFVDKQAIARGLVTQLPHATLGTVPSVTNPIRMDGQPAMSETGPPVLGQHSKEILEQLLGMDDAKIKSLIENKIIEDINHGR